MDTISVIDFGGQYAHLIANRIRRAGVFAEIVLPVAATPERLAKSKGIVLSGGPASVLARGAPTLDPAIFRLGIPVLAICYGHQLTTHLLGGKVAKGQTAEYGPAKLKLAAKSPILAKVKTGSRVWMSHFDQVTQLPAGFEVIASTADCPFAAAQLVGAATAGGKSRAAKKSAEAPLAPIFSLQFHPEVTHTECGAQIFANFLALTKAKRSWSIDSFLRSEITKIKKTVGQRRVFLLVSGGVDSTVAFALLEKALGKKRVFGLLVDHGLMRSAETELVTASLRRAGFDNLFVANESKHFLAALKNAVEPEDKRRIIGRVFLKVQRKILKRLGFNPRQWLLGQGTIYPDTIESGGTANADKIKTHHNRVPEIQKMLEKGLVIEPLAELYKDEVRAVGRELGLPAGLIDRHPFPGPGLGVRLICARTEDRLAQSLRIEQEVKRKWKLAAKLLPIRSVGVQGDARTYRHALAIFTSSRDWARLDRMATEIINKFPDLNRIVLCLNKAKAPRRIKFHPATLTAERITRLQAADAAASKVLQTQKLYHQVWQMPVVLAPIGETEGGESVILRPVESTEAMTASFARLSAGVVSEMSKRILADRVIEYVFYDLTNKPPGTIEWE